MTKGGMVLDNYILFFIVILLFNKKESSIKEVLMNTYENLTNTLDVEGTYEKLGTLRKIGPYFPEWIVPILNKSILITEKIIKTFELFEFMQMSNSNVQIVHKDLENNKERFNQIISTLRKEVPEEKLNEKGTLMNIILNYDKYKLMLVLMNQIMSNPQKLNDPEQLSQLMNSTFKEKFGEDEKKMKELLRMIDIIKVLDPTNKNKKAPKND